jgi:hypothetical protein
MRLGNVGSADPPGVLAQTQSPRGGPTAAMGLQGPRVPPPSPRSFWGSVGGFSWLLACARAGRPNHPRDAGLGLVIQGHGAVVEPTG